MGDLLVTNNEFDQVIAMTIVSTYVGTKKYEEYLQGFNKYLDRLGNKVALFAYLDEKSVSDEPELAPVIFLPIIEVTLDGLCNFVSETVWDQG